MRIIAALDNDASDEESREDEEEIYSRPPVLGETAQQSVAEFGMTVIENDQRNGNTAQPIERRDVLWQPLRAAQPRVGTDQREMPSAGELAVA
jgi:hypothetical protein